MSNETNAMENKEATNLQIPNNNDPKQPIDTNNAFTFKFWNYLTDLRQKTKFTRNQYAKIFNDYIQDDICKYITVEILTLHRLTQPYHNPELYKLIDTPILASAFISDLQGTKIPKIRQFLADIGTKKEKTNEEKIILLLCEPGWLGIDDSDECFKQIELAINDYNNEEINIEDQNETKHPIDSIALESINQLVQLHYHYHKQLSAAPKQKLNALAKIVQEFTNAYKRKHNQPTQIQPTTEPPKQQNNKVQQTTDASDYKTAQKNVEKDLTQEIIANLKITTAQISAIINTLLR